MKYIIHRIIRERATDALDWVKTFIAGYDTSVLGWLRIDFGREHRDRLGRIHYRYRGIYGRCWYPSKDQPTVRMSCQVPGPFPCDVDTRKKPIYRNPDGTWPEGIKVPRGKSQRDPRSGREWKRVYGKTRVHTLDEGIVWIVSHEAYHWLKITRQIPGRNNEVEADAYADRHLLAFRDRHLKAASAGLDPKTELWLPGFAKLD